MPCKIEKKMDRIERIRDIERLLLENNKGWSLIMLF